MKAKCAFFVLTTLSMYPGTVLADRTEYYSCVTDNARFYGSFCFATEDIVDAARASCRKHTANMFNDTPLTDGDKMELIVQFMEVADEQIVRNVLDHRLQEKIDCGQYNPTMGPDALDQLQDR